ncbi:MAG: ATP-dependent DNA helicase [Lachnospiraceae bacterium]|nr:ATP-dependent DNA helicase [Lachnospiraceae bacterium]
MMEYDKRTQLHISVRNLVEFILRSGNIDNRHKSGPENAMQEGSRIHRLIQRRMGTDYHAEVPLKLLVHEDDYDLLIDGRADGIIIPMDGTIIIDEIKCIYKDLIYLNEPYETHLAQAKCYAYIYAKQENRRNMLVRMTYCNIDTEEIKYFNQDYTFEDLDVWFLGIYHQYKKWADFEYHWKKNRQQSIQKLEFPFPYRDGQKELVAQVYRTIYHKKRLFIEAPTGVGKTISTLFPTIKAVGEGLGDKIFYLTAKTVTASVAFDTYTILRQKGLKYKTVTLTAKEKMCPLEETECNPDHCPYADGHYNRINQAVFELLSNEDAFSREMILDYANRHMVCSFELGLDMALFSDGIICDYNYVFDPHAYLRRFFSEGITGNYLFLVDEAHNLVERGREMYSATLYKEDFLEIKKLVKIYDKKLERYLESCNRQLLELKRECDNYQVLPGISSFSLALTRAASQMEKWLEEDEGSEIRKDVFKFYMEIRHFLSMEERIDDNYEIYSEIDENGRFFVKLFCVQPSKNLRECLDKANSTILFSATLLPIRYYINLITGDLKDYAVYAKSTFSIEKLGLFIGTDISSKYSRRGTLEYYNIAFYLSQITQAKGGNYLVFFPSYVFLRNVYETYMDHFIQENQEIVLQQASMNEREREEFLEAFKNDGIDNETAAIDISTVIQMEVEIEKPKTLIGFCVLGGIFSEGIDLKNDSLIGSIIVGTGIPQVCSEREILKQYFDEKGMNGFDYAYRFPGMNKVLQSAGRVIRTTEDVGVVALLDDRFTSNQYQRLFPEEWKNIEYTTKEQVLGKIKHFWEQNK